MRLTPEQLVGITHRVRPKQQAAWFREYLGAEVPTDAEGPILTSKAFEALLAKKLGVGPVEDKPAPESRPVVHPPRPKKPLDV